jgi:hypothetical protein
MKLWSSWKKAWRKTQLKERMIVSGIGALLYAALGVVSLFKRLPILSDACSQLGVIIGHRYPVLLLPAILFGVGALLSFYSLRVAYTLLGLQAARK